MSQFLQNLINRHQEVGVRAEVSGEASPMVQPRPKSRFEMNAGSSFFGQNDLNNNDSFNSTSQSGVDSESYSVQHSQDAEPIITTLTTNNKQSSQPAQAPAQHDLERSAVEPHAGPFMQSLSERMSITTRQLEKNLARQDISQLTPKEGHDRQTEHIEGHSEFSSHLNNQHQLITNEFNQRIETVRQRLNNSQSHNNDNAQENKLPHKNETNVGHNTPVQAEMLPLIAEQNSSSIQPVIAKKEKQGEEKRSNHQKVDQSGLMQIPSWLTEMQADLNNRLQQMSTKAQSEPVINVTIGRIEVKAIQAEPGKTKIRPKPSGVMGLDEYLKQRESRGRG